MKGFTLLAAGLACALPTISAADVAVSHFETLQRLEIAGPARTAQQKLSADAPASVNFDAFGRNFDLELEPNHQLLSASARGELPRSLTAYRGSVAGNAASWSRIVIAADGLPRGLVWDGKEMYALEVRQDDRTGAAAPVMYRLEDVYVPPGSVACGAMHVTAPNAAAVYDKLVGELDSSMAKSSDATAEIHIGAVGDYEFFKVSGDDSATAILTRLNNVDGIFSAQLGVRIVVDELTVFTSPSDPFTDTAVPGDLLKEVSGYRSRTARQRAQGLTHLYTGRKLDGNTVGIAYTNTLCEASWAAGLSQSGANVTFDSLVAAHEIGHNFGAPHDGVSGSACAAEQGGYLMSTSINGNDQFSSCSIQHMRSSIRAASCIVPLPTIDPGITLSGSVEPVAVGQSATATFNVANAGTARASGVTVDIVLPAIVSLESATVSQGTCTNGAGTVTCSIGDLPAGSNRSVTLAVTAVDAGGGELAARVSAHSDDDPANNEIVMPFTVKEAAAAGAAVAPTMSSAQGGGGAIGLPWLMLLLGLAGFARRDRGGALRPY